LGQACWPGVSRLKVGPDQGDVVWLDFDPRAGHEQAGRRPAVVLTPRSYNARSGLALVCRSQAKPKDIRLRFRFLQGRSPGSYFPITSQAWIGRSGTRHTFPGFQKQRWRKSWRRSRPCCRLMIDSEDPRGRGMPATDFGLSEPRRKRLWAKTAEARAACMVKLSSR